MMLHAVGVLAVALARVLAPVDREAGEGDPNRAELTARNHIEVGLEGGAGVVDATAARPLGVLRREAHLEAAVCLRRAHGEVQGAIDVCRCILEVGLRKEAVGGTHLTEAGRVQERDDSALATKAAESLAHRERGVRLATHDGVIHDGPLLVGGLAIEGRKRQRRRREGQSGRKQRGQHPETSCYQGTLCTRGRHQKLASETNYS